VTANDVPRADLPNWIAGRLHRQGQSANQETLAFLAERCEGNLLAAFQEIQKLALLFPAGQLAFDPVKDVVMDVARYDVFKLADAMLKGNAARFAHILDGLRAEGTATVLILWAMNEEIQALGRVLQAMQHGGNLGNAMRDARVWGAKQAGIESAVRRLKFPQVLAAVQHSLRVDKTIKGLRDGDVWDELLQLGLRLTR
jgi:DNA polymerase-3 subunit delta